MDFVRNDFDVLLKCLEVIYKLILRENTKVNFCEIQLTQTSRRIFQRIQNLKLVGYACHQYT